LVYRVVSTPLFVAKDEHHHHRREEEKEEEKEEESKSRLIPTHSEKRER
jgi:hypothetical protein